jgi:predicted amidohydrolase YtcJ
VQVVLKQINAMKLFPLKAIQNLIRVYMIIFLLCFLSARSYGQFADLVMQNGKIFTSDTKQLYVEALAIKENKILAVGTNAEIQKLISAKTRKIDLKGKVVVPGFNDAHDHLGWQLPVGGLSYAYTQMEVAGLAKEAVLDSISRLVKKAKPGQWLHGNIGTTVLHDVNMRSALDSIAPNNPVLLEIWWGHGVVLNSKAMHVVGISETAADPPGGWYNRVKGTGVITGAMYEYAQWPAWHAMITSEPTILVKALQQYALEELQFGITTVQDMSCNIEPSAINHIFGTARLPLHVRIVPFPGTTQKGRSLNEWINVKSKPAPFTYVSGIKYLIDGTPLEQNAFMTKPYDAMRGWYGRLDFPIDTIKEILHEALTSHAQLMMHIVGDSSLSIVLSLMTKMASADTWKVKRVRIEHNAVSNITLPEKQIVKDLGIIMMHTPVYSQRSPVRSLLEYGIAVGISPDGYSNPLLNIMIITGQQSDSKENISREQAVIAYTKTNAYAEFAEKRKGILAKGMLADLAVLSQDIFTVPIEQLPATRSILTMVEGKIVYERN